MRSGWRWCVLVLACLASSGCGDEVPVPPGAPAEQILDIQLTLVDETIVLGGSLLCKVEGAGAIVPAAARVVLNGAIDGRPVEASIGADFVETSQGLDVSVGWDKLVNILAISGEAEFQGSLRVELDDLGGGLKGIDELPTAIIFFRESLRPGLDLPSQLEIFADDQLRFPAEGLLRPGEGTTDLLVDGTFSPTDGSAATLVSAVLPVAVGASRQDAVVHWSVVVFGIKPGSFSGTLRPVNNHELGGRLEGDTLNATIALLPSEIDGFDPPAASRGQIMRALGRGFISADANLGQSMFFTLDGSFRTRGGTVIDFSGPKAIQVAPEAVPSHTEAQLVLRSTVEDRGGVLTLVGLTAAPGSFQGTITPVLVQGNNTVFGRPFQGTLEVAPTLQRVFVRFLPNFSEALDSFGMRNVEPEIRARIFAVLERDYAGVNIEFSDIRPDDFVEYTIIEVGGPDPNGAGLFGLDNSAGKDTGNIRLNDIVGSQNAESGDLGFYVFGGVFIESFRTFSPSLDPGSTIASGNFDQIFRPFMPALGGIPIDAAEWPDGPRVADIELAIFSMGNLIGGTITHEIGHSLGMSFFQEDLFTDSMRFHNDFDEEGSIMDAGQNRPFEERVEFGDAPKPHFNERNSAYLQMILPLP